MDVSPWLTAAEAAAYLKLDLHTLRNYTSRGLLPYCKQPLTGTVRYHRGDLDTWLRAGQRGPSL